MSVLEIDLEGKKYWLDKYVLDNYNKFQKKLEKELFDHFFYGIFNPKFYYECETFYFVILGNKEKTTLGMKSRITNNIFICNNNREPDINLPIENTNFVYIRDARSMDL